MSIEFLMPEPIKDFVFDLYQSSRRSLRTEDVQLCYDKRNTLSEKYFNSSAWPEPQSIAAECNNDSVFLLFYREMTLRHIFTKLKPQLNEYINAWGNYQKLFGFLINSTGEPDLALSVQWACDIVQEFVYQFQSFCQYRIQYNSKSSEDVSLLQNNREVWTLSGVTKILRGIIEASKIETFQASRTIGSANGGPTSAMGVLGYFAIIESARLECLLGDYSASLKALTPIRLYDRTELFMTLPTCHANLFYHTGICLIMSRRYADAIEVFSDIILHISRVLKPGAAVLRQPVQNMLQKMSDKALALVAIGMSLCPSYRVDDQVRELVESKYEDRVRRLVAGDMPTFEAMFESACPKFVSAAIPDYLGAVHLHHDTFRQQLSVFLTETQHQVALLRLRSYLRLYTSISLEKLARFNDVSVPELASLLLSLKHQTMQIQSATTLDGVLALDVPRSSTSDVSFYVQDDILFINSLSANSLDKSRASERVFLSGIRKHAELKQDIDRIFKSFGL